MDNVRRQVTIVTKGFCRQLFLKPSSAWMMISFFKILRISEFFCKLLRILITFYVFTEITKKTYQEHEGSQSIFFFCQVRVKKISFGPTAKDCIYASVNFLCSIESKITCVSGRQRVCVLINQCAKRLHTLEM